uniref:Uncharacterized protein n=1 Tax=Physcomitrium patens TaxID=3218 RepID=A0A2K1JPR1_PHYPA|nr:hypothetical protein PHYPA_015898 [Physcomitrium patens]
MILVANWLHGSSNNSKIVERVSRKTSAARTEHDFAPRQPPQMQHRCTCLVEIESRRLRFMRSSPYTPIEGGKKQFRSAQSSRRREEKTKKQERSSGWTPIDEEAAAI